MLIIFTIDSYSILMTKHILLVYWKTSSNMYLNVPLSLLDLLLVLMQYSDFSMSLDLSHHRFFLFYNLNVMTKSTQLLPKALLACISSLLLTVLVLLTPYA